jgi:hypothetical protein
MPNNVISSDDDVALLMNVGENGTSDEEGNVLFSKPESPRINTQVRHELTGLAASITILEDTSLGVGGQLWPAAKCLVRYLLDTRPFPSKNHLPTIHVVELGAGTALVGLVTAMMLSSDSKVYVTDIDVMVETMVKNVGHNQSTLDNKKAAKVVPRVLWWGKPIPEELLYPQVVLCADCVYLESGFVPLIQTMWEMCGQETIVYFCYKKRWKSSKRFFVKLKKLFDVTTDDARKDENAKQGLYIYTLKKKLKPTIDPNVMFNE